MDRRLVGRGHRVEGWYFGVTRENRKPKPALKLLEDYYCRKPLDLREEWPRASVIACAYHAQGSIDECLWSLTELDYPNYEVLVVDDGFTDASAQIASRFQVRLLSRDCLGFSEARNMALEQARGGFVA
jgi:O-antigen biosynthesis protein